MKDKINYFFAIFFLLGVFCIFLMLYKTSKLPPCYPNVETAIVKTVFHSPDASFGGYEHWNGHALIEGKGLVEYETTNPVFEGYILESKSGCGAMNQPF